MSLVAADSSWLVVPASHFTRGRDGHQVSGVVQHYTGAGNGHALARWIASDDARVSAHILITRKGKVIQQVSFDDTAWHAGTRSSRPDFWRGKKPQTNVNNFTIGIENSNRGWLIEESGVFYLPRKVDGEWVKGRRYKGPAPLREEGHDGIDRWWEPYTDELIAANISVLRRIRELYPNFARLDVQPHSAVSPTRKHDPGPLWPDLYVLDEVFSTGGVKPTHTTSDPSAEDEHDDQEELFSRRDLYDEEGEMCLLPEEDTQP